MPWSWQLASSETKVALTSAASSLPTKSQFFLPTAEPVSFCPCRISCARRVSVARGGGRRSRRALPRAAPRRWHGCFSTRQRPPSEGRPPMMLRELPPRLLARRAVVYVRQSTGMQVQENLESKRRQYALADLARQYGFSQVSVIDEDLGRS